MHHFVSITVAMLMLPYRPTDQNMAGVHSIHLAWHRIILHTIIVIMMMKNINIIVCCLGSVSWTQLNFINFLPPHKKEMAVAAASMHQQMNRNKKKRGRSAIYIAKACLLSCLLISLSLSDLVSCISSPFSSCNNYWCFCLPHSFACNSASITVANAMQPKTKRKLFIIKKNAILLQLLID